MNKPEAESLIADLCGYYPTYPVDPHTVALYGEKLAAVTFDDGYLAVQDWAFTEDHFPKLSELLERVGKVRGAQATRRAIQAAQSRRQPGTVACVACDDSGLEWQPSTTHHPAGSYPDWVLPCSACRPRAHRDWAEGHQRANHDVFSCDWAECVRRREYRTTHRTTSPSTLEPVPGDGMKAS